VGSLEIAEFQTLMRRTSIERDSKRGVGITALWLTSEIGNAADALINRNQIALKEEVVDVFAWLCSLCNIIGVCVEESAIDRYGGQMPKIWTHTTYLQQHSVGEFYSSSLC